MVNDYLRFAYVDFSPTGVEINLESDKLNISIAELELDKVKTPYSFGLRSFMKNSYCGTDLERAQQILNSLG